MNKQTIIRTYSRARAIDEGVDVTEAAIEAGFKYPVVLTHTVWSDYVVCLAGVDEACRLWDILTSLRHSTQNFGDDDAILFGLHVQDYDRDRTPAFVELKAVCGLDDNGRRCITVMLPRELKP